VQKGAAAKQQQKQQQLPMPGADLMYATSLEAAMELLEQEGVSQTIDTVFVIGGGQVSSRDRQEAGLTEQAARPAHSSAHKGTATRCILQRSNWACSCQGQAGLHSKMQEWC
jgi:hypothetical protein